MGAGEGADKAKADRAGHALIRNGQPLAIIAVPDEAAYQDLARQLQQRLGRDTDGIVPIVAAKTLVTGLVDAWTPEVQKPLGQGGRHLILLGDLTSNAAVRRLYYQWQAFEDGAYPGQGGYTVRTVVDPEGLGWNAIILGGQSATAVAQAVEAFVGKLQRQDRSVAMPYTLEVKWGEGVGVAGMKAKAENVAARMSEWDRFLLDPTSAAYKQFRPAHGAFDYAQDLLNVGLGHGALHYALSGTPELAQMAGRAIETLYRQMEWIEAHRTVSWDAHYSYETWLRSWQQIANCPLLTDAQRAHGAAFFGFLAGQAAMYQWPLDSYGKTTYRSLSRHEYAGIFAGDALCRQMLKHDEVQPPLADLLRANRANFGVVIDTMLQEYCDGFDHKWGLDANWCFFQAAVEEPRPQFVESGMARLCADYTTMVINNAGDFVNYGSENVSPLEGYDAWQVLGRAEAIFRDGGYQWWTSRYLKQPYKAFIAGMYYLGHWFQPAAGPGREPTRFIGLNRLLLSRHIHEDLRAGRGRLPSGLPVVNDVPYEQGFNKITLRDGLQPDDQYLLLDGLGGVTYSGNDAGAICEYSRYGQRLLVQIEGKQDPFYQNFVSVARGNALEPSGAFARLTDLTDLGSMMYVRLEVDPLCGAKAVRHLFMERGQFCLAFDDVTVKEEDEYAITSTWRAMGTPKGTFTFEGEKADLHIDNIVFPGVGEPQYTIGERTAGTSQREADFKIHVLRETVARRFKAGETYRYANVFGGARHGEAFAAGRAAALSDTAVLVGDTQPTLHGAALQDRIALGNVTLSAAACRVGRDTAQLVRVKQISADGKVLLKLAAPVTLSLELSGQRIIAQSPESKQVGTINWEPQWRVTGTWAQAAKGLALPGGGTLKMNVEAVWAVLQANLKPSTAPPPAPPIERPWPQIKPPAQVWSSAAAINATCLADLDGDGSEEVITACGDGRVVAMDLQGKEKLNISLGDEPLLSCWAGQLGGQLTILVGGQKGALVALDPAGKTLWRARNARWWYGPGPAIYSLAVGDFAGDGGQMIACGTHGGGSLFDAHGQFVSFTQTYSHAMQPLQAVSIYGGRQQWALGATWGGGLKLWQPLKQQIVEGWFHSWGRVAYDVQMLHVGEDLWFLYAGPHGIAGARLDKAAFLAGKRDAPSVWQDSWYLRSDGETTAVLPLDMNGDGTPEVLTANETGFLVWYSLKGERLGKKLVGMQARALAVRDMTGDGRPELVLAGEFPQVLVLDRQTLQPVGGWQDETNWPVTRMLDVPQGLVLASEHAIHMVTR